MTKTEHDTARRAAFDRKLRNASHRPDSMATIYDDEKVYLRGEWDIPTLAALLQSYTEGT